MADGSVAVVFGGPSPEHDISILTGLLAERVLRDAGVAVTPLYWTRTGDWVLCPPAQEGKDFLEGPPKGGRELVLQMGAGILAKKGLGGAKPLVLDAALNCCHGGAGENGGLNAVFDQLGIAMTGGPPPLAALGMDKLAFGAVLSASGVPTLARAAVTSAEPGFAGPYIVKPRFGGSSIGIEIVEDMATARALATSSPLMRSGAVVEPFHAGAQDLNLALRTHPALQVSLLEKPLSPDKSEGIYSYEQKYLSSQGLASAPRELPAQVGAEVTAEAERLAGLVVAATGIRGLCRLDFLLVDGVLHVNEINTIPGSMGLYLWPAEVKPADLLLSAVEEARGAPRDASGAFEPGAALRAAGGIAGKLGQIGAGR